MNLTIDTLKAAIRDVPDYPKPGIIFKDITTLLNKKDLLDFTIQMLIKDFKTKNIDYVVGMESRGFIFGAPAAINLGAGFVPIRKPGKLPAQTLSESYQLEYGTDTLEIHADAFPKESRILIIDDLLATGGTAEASVKLVKKAGGNIVGIGFVIELAFLNGREKIKNYKVISLIKY